METRTAAVTKLPEAYKRYSQPLTQQTTPSKDLHGHLREVMSTLVLHTHPSQSLEKLEEVSYLLKNPQLKETFMRTSVNNDYSRGGD